MVDLFRYIEQSFVVPPAKPDAIDVSDTSDFQNNIRNEVQLKKSNQEIRKEAENFISKNLVNDADFYRSTQQYLDLHEKLLALPSPTIDKIDDVIEKVFNSSSSDLVSSDAFKKNKHLLNDLIIAVKMTTGFDKVRANDLVAIRQAIAFIETISDRGHQTYSSMYDVNATLLRPILVPSVFLKKPAEKPVVGPKSTADPDEVTKRKALEKEYKSLEAAYGTLMSLRPDQLEMREVQGIQKPAIAEEKPLEFRSQNIKPFTEAPQQVLVLNEAAIRKLDPSVLKMFEAESLDIKTTDISRLVQTVKYETGKIQLLLNPVGQVKAETKVFRLGIHAFAIKSAPAPIQASAATTPDFSHAIFRPVGVGDLQVVRQELVGYEAKEISHIENVLEGEILRHSTKRSDTTEVTVTEETLTTQTDERDLQSTIRNEMASESQKEAGQQSSSAQDQTSTTSYGKLVENNKSNYAKTVTDRAVSSLSQQVKHQRIQREKKTFVEKSLHEFDNSKTGAKNITGIYQWVDKKYKTRIMNYGTRLLYDVVVPEPAAFLIESLKNAPQPEGLELIKPDVFDLCPSALNKSNYACLAAKYGVTGSVTPPHEEFMVATPKSDSLEVSKKITSFGATIDGVYYGNFPIKIPEGYKAMRGFITRLMPIWVRGEDRADQDLIFYIGENYFITFGKIDLPPTTPDQVNKSFQMQGETGEVPVIFHSTRSIVQFNFAMGIVCQITVKLLEEWQLKTHAVIMNGYNRQLAEYQDKLAKFQAIVRTQIAQAGNYAHNPSIEQAELKRAFIYLLLSEHFNSYIPTPNPMIPGSPASGNLFFITIDPVFIMFLNSDPAYMKKWGALVAFFERAFEWENIMFTYYPYFWGRSARWGELILIQDINPQFEEFLKAGAARVVLPVRPGFEAALAHYHETGDIWMGEEMPDIYSPLYVSIIQEIKARNFAPGKEICVAEWDVTLPTTLVMLKDDAILPKWDSTVKCTPVSE